jgi:hypothetical protein
MSMKVILTLVALVASVTAAAAQADRIDGADITQFGVYEYKVTNTQELGGTAAGTLKTVDYKFVSKTTSFPARRGVGFGFEYRVRGAPKDAKVPLRSVTIFPDGGVRNPKTGETVLRNEYVEEKAIGALLLKGYTLDDDWEVVPGTWTFQVWFGDQLLAEKIFTLTRP